MDRKWLSSSGAGGSWEEVVWRVFTPGKPAFQLRSGEEGLSVFNPSLVNPPLTRNEVLGSFRPGSDIAVRSIQQITGLGLTVVRTPGDSSLPVRLQQAHMEIRPGAGMTRNEFKRALRGLE